MRKKTRYCEIHTLLPLLLKTADQLFAEYGSWCWQSALWWPTSSPTSKAGPFEFWPKTTLID